MELPLSCWVGELLPNDSAYAVVLSGRWFLFCGSLPEVWEALILHTGILPPKILHDAREVTVFSRMI